MSLVEISLLAVAAFFALNMGGSGFAPAFAVALGSKTISRVWSTLLYAALVVVGALLFGNMVAKTLSSGIVSEGALPPYRALIVLGAATSALFLANYLKVPQSTSWVTIFALVGMGLVIGDLNQQTILRRLLPAWVGLPTLAYILTWMVIRVFYPLREANFRPTKGWRAARAPSSFWYSRLRATSRRRSDPTMSPTWSGRWCRADWSTRRPGFYWRRRCSGSARSCFRPMPKRLHVASSRSVHLPRAWSDWWLEACCSSRHRSGYLSLWYN